MSTVSFIASTDRHGQLMLAYAGGDLQAFEELYRHYRGPLYRYFQHQCGSRAIAEELYQELWLKVISSRNSYEHRARFSTWLYHIAHNLIVDHLRRQHPEVEVAEADDLPASPADDPALRYSSQEKISRFLAMLRQLPDGQRQVFLLKEADLSLDEIARVTGISFEAVKSRLRYAVKKLRAAMEDAA